MLKTIIWKELIETFISIKFFTGLVLCFLLFSISSFVLIGDFRERLQSYNAALRKHRDELENTEVYSHLRIKLDRKPEVLSVFCEGVERRFGNTVTVTHGSVPYEAEEYGTENPYSVVLLSLDLTIIIQIVLSLLALLFTYDAISGKLAMLRLVLSNPVPRSVVLLGKYLGRLICVIVIFTFSFIALLLIMQSIGTTFNRDEWLRIGFIFFTTVLYISLFSMLGIFISSLSSRSSTSLMLSLFTWVFLVVIFPNVSSFLTERVVKTERKYIVTNNEYEVWKEYQRKVNEEMKRIGISDFMSFIVNSGGSMKFQSDSYGEKFIYHRASKDFVEKFGKAIALREKLRVQYADMAWQVRQDYNRKLIKKAQFSKAISSLSPSFLYYNIVSVFSSTDLESFLLFLKNAREYRRTIIQYFWDKEAFSSAQWFTDDYGKVNLEDLPSFKYKRENLSSSFQRVSFELLSLFILNVFLYMLSGYFFKASELRVLSN